MKILVIGDIHGCYAELQDLIDLAGIADDDSIIALGDIVDRGPETPQVLDFFRRHPGARSLMGNHERKHVRAARGELKLSLSQVITRSQAREAYQDALQYMESFPTWIDLPEAILVHGYLEPGVPLEEQPATVLCGTMGGEKHLRTRYDQPWYELYNAEKPVLVGHCDYLRNGQVFIHNEQVFGLDTSCVHGRRLSGLVLPDFTIISVPGRRDYWYDSRRFYRQQHPIVKQRPRPVEVPEWDEASDRSLQEIIDRVTQESQQLLTRLNEQPGFSSLTHRQQARLFAAEIGSTPLAPFMHLARRGELDLERARKLLKHPDRIIQLV